eukprot:SAG31_NODE_11541_length_1019_cov_1.109783_1_plen_116_part_00
MENVGENTLFWYGTWPEVDADGVRCAKWARDRLGYLATDPLLNQQTPYVVSCPIAPGKPGTSLKVSLNVDGVDAEANISVELLTEQFAKIPGLLDVHRHCCLQIVDTTSLRLHCV